MKPINLTCENYSIDSSIFELSVGDIAIKLEPLLAGNTIMDTFFRFMKDENLSLIPVVENNIVVGQLQRNRFLENTVLGRFGYGIHLNARKTVAELMEKPTYLIDYNTKIEDASMIVQKKELRNIYDDIIVINKGKYYGIVPINLLLEAITQKSLIMAKDSNPITGLPGNWAIQREIEKRIRCRCSFDVCYIDLNHFKPFNDHYGFEKGDRVIKAVGDILKEQKEIFPEIFTGHIGGDDFIVITPAGISQLICERVLTRFEELLPALHGEDFVRGYYVSKNRKAEEEVFSLLSLTCAIVSRENREISSFGQLASIASEVKAEAKRLSRIKKGSVIFKDRRNE